MFYCGCDNPTQEPNFPMASAMKRQHCEHIRFSGEFDEGQFNKKAFHSALNIKDKKLRSFHSMFQRQDASRKEHAHLMIHFAGENSEFRMMYAPGTSEDPDREGGPYFDDLAPWFAQFFEKPEIRVDVFAVFEYSRIFESVIQLNYPVLVNDERFTESKIIGHDISFGDHEMIHKATISSLTKGGLVIFLNATVRLDFSFVEIDWVIDKLSGYAKALVKRKEKNATK